MSLTTTASSPDLKDSPIGGAQRQARRWMQEGIKQHLKFKQDFQSAKEAAFTSGIFFHKARHTIEHGEWGPLVAEFASEISETSVRRYVEFAEEMIAWAQAEHPRITNQEEIIKLAKTMVLQSPKGYIALCRQLGAMRKFGEYDEVKYRKRKLLGDAGAQIEFDFAVSIRHLEALTHFGDDNYTFKFPEDTDPEDYLSDVEQKLTTALERIKQAKAKL